MHVTANFFMILFYFFIVKRYAMTMICGRVCSVLLLPSQMTWRIWLKIRDGRNSSSLINYKYKYVDVQLQYLNVYIIVEKFSTQYACSLLVLSACSNLTY